MSELDDLREQARKARQNATRKVGRLERKGVKVSNTEYDPRRDANILKRYTRTQLRNYLTKLLAFNSRRTAFVPGARGVPLPRRDVLNYQKRVRQYNAVAQRARDAQRDVFIPAAGMTVGERDDMIRPKDRRTRAAGNTIARPHETDRARNPYQVTSKTALNKLQRDLEKRLGTGHADSVLRNYRRGFLKMLKYTGDEELIARARKLTPAQFETMFVFAELVNQVSLRYELAKQKQDYSGGDLSRGKQMVYDDTFGRIEEGISWASTLPKQQSDRSRSNYWRAPKRSGSGKKQES